MPYEPKHPKHVAMDFQYKFTYRLHNPIIGAQRHDDQYMHVL